MNHRIVSVKLYLAVFGGLIALTFTTVAVSKLELGEFNFVAAITIAIVKAMLVILFFMDVRHAASLTKLFIGAGVVWMSILIIFVLSDYWSRTWLPGATWWPN